MKDLAASKSPSTLMVDIPWFGPIPKEVKFIFNRHENSSILFKLKKLIWGNRMQEVAKAKLTQLCDASSTNENIKTLLQKIKTTESPAIETIDVLKAFSRSDQANAYIVEDPLIGMPEELVAAVHQYEKEQVAKPVTTEELIDTIETYHLKNKLSPEIGDRLKSALPYLKRFHNNRESVSDLTERAEVKGLLTELGLYFDNYAPTAYLQKIQREINRLSTIINPKYETTVAAQANIVIQNLPRWLFISQKINHKDFLDIADGLQTNMPVFSSSHNNQLAYKTFLDFIENPNKYAKDKQAHQYLYQFLNLFYEDISKLDPKLRSLCMKQIDKLEGILQHHQNLDLHAHAETGLNEDAQIMLTTLRDQIEISGPSASMLHLFQYVLHQKNAIHPLSFWHLSGLSNIQKETISSSLPKATKEKFKKSMANLKKHLKEFEVKQLNILNSLNRQPKAADARKIIITHIALKLNSVEIFKANEQNKAASDVFLDQLSNASANFISPLIQAELEEFFSLFYNNITKLDVDTRILFLREIDRLRGLILKSNRTDIEKYDVMKLKNNSLIDFATALKLNAEQLGPSAFIIDLLHYLENGNKAITPATYWALNHVATIKRASIAALLGSPQKSYFSSAMMQLTADLKAFKAAQTPSAPS